MSGDYANDFPVWGLLPKRETNVTSFLAKHPEYDGRGVCIAIFDSGIDPGAKGLQQTSDGKPKIIEMVDATGAGDVDTSTVIEAIDGYLNFPSGIKCKVPSHWKNPTGKYHIGIKNAYELYPKSLKERVIKERKEKFWDPEHKTRLSEVNRKLQVFNNEHLPSTQLTLEEKLIKEDLEAQIEMLNTLEKKYCDVGPAYNCIVFHDGEYWRAVIDTEENGELEKCKVLGSYYETHDYARLTEMDQLNYCINVHDDGDLLEIVSNSSAHGTHVASIAAAYFPDDPEMNGIAPGACIISVGIGDLRLQSMETGAALTRALIKVIQRKCDVINISYGEHAHWCGGRLMELVHQVVDKAGIIMVASAGNHGPALSTVGTPPTCPTNSIIGVGAYVSPDMMLAEYSMREKCPGLGYTWTSRGPGSNGSLSVSVCAPGGAITSVPTWTLRGSQLLNGTSMSSPHVAGCICVLVSGLKQCNVSYSPYSIRRAIENTAVKINSWDAFSMGHGLIQVDKAFDNLTTHSNLIETFVRFNVTCNHQSGIYLRDSCKTKSTSVYNISVEPIFLGDVSTDPESKINFNMNLKLVCDAPWVFVPSNLCLMYCPRSFNIRIDPTGLSVGEHFTWIKAYDCVGVDKEPVFHFPITVIISRKITEEPWSWVVHSSMFYPGKVVREFIEVPAGATVASLRITSCDSKNNGCIVVHAMQLRPQLFCKAHEFYKMIRLSPRQEATCVFPVKEKLVLELAFAQWWNCIEPVHVSYSISFRGLQPDSPQIVMHGADGIHRIDVSSLLTYEEMYPSVTLKSYTMVLRPTESKINPLKHRDVIPNGRQVYENLLTYALSIGRSSELTPSFSLLSELLYESEFESQLWMLYDCNKQLMACGDAYPSKYTAKVEKGEYILKVQVRHEDCNLLEKLSEAPMLVGVKMQTSISMDIYDKHSLALIGGKKINSQIVPPGCKVPIFLAPIPTDKFPKSVYPGYYLQGTISFCKDDAIKKVDTYSFKYIVPELPKKPSAKTPNEDKKPIDEEYLEEIKQLNLTWMAKTYNFKYIAPELPEKKSPKQTTEEKKTLEEKYLEEIKELNIKWITKLTGSASKDLFDNLMEKEKDATWPILLARLQSLDKENDKIPNQKETLLAIIEVGDSILSTLNSIEILAALGLKNEKKDSSTYKKYEAQKNCIIETLVKKGKAMVELYSLETSEKSASPTESVTTEDSSDTLITFEKIDEIYTELLKWTEMNDLKVVSFVEKHAVVRSHFGRALKILQKIQDEKKYQETELKCIDLFKKLGWDHCVTFFKRSYLVRFPPSYQLF